MPSVHDPRLRSTDTPPERPPPPGCVPRRHHSESPLSHNHQHSRNSSNSSTSSQLSSHSARGQRPRATERRDERTRRQEIARRQSEGAVRRRGDDARNDHRGRHHHDEDQRRYREEMERERRRNHDRRRSGNSQSSRSRRSRPEITIVSAQPMFDHPAFADGDKGGYIPPEAPPSYEQAIQTPAPLNPTFTNPTIPDHISEVRRVFPRTQILHCNAITIPSYSSTVTSQTIQHSSTAVTSSSTIVTSSHVSTTNVTSLYVNCSTSVTSQLPVPRQRNINHSNNSRQSGETSNNRERYIEGSSSRASHRTSPQTNSSNKNNRKPLIPAKNPNLLKSPELSKQQRPKPSLPVKNPVLKPKPRTILENSENNSNNSNKDDSLTPSSGTNLKESSTASSSGKILSKSRNEPQTLNPERIRSSVTKETMSTQPPVPVSRANKNVMNLLDEPTSSNLPAPLFPGATNQILSPNSGSNPNSNYSAFDSLQSNQPQGGVVSAPNSETSKYSVFDSLRSNQPQGGDTSTPQMQSGTSKYSVFDLLRPNQSDSTSQSVFSTGTRPLGGSISQTPQQPNVLSPNSVGSHPQGGSMMPGMQQNYSSATTSPLSGSISQPLQQPNVFPPNLVGNNPQGGSMMMPGVQQNYPRASPNNNILQPASQNATDPMSPMLGGQFQQTMTPASMAPPSGNIGGVSQNANTPRSIPAQNNALVPPTGKIFSSQIGVAPTINPMQSTPRGQVAPTKVVPPPRPTSAPKRNPSIVGKSPTSNSSTQGGSAVQGGLLLGSNSPQNTNKTAASMNQTGGLVHNHTSQPLGGTSALTPQQGDIFSTSNPTQSSPMMGAAHGGAVVPGGLISPMKSSPGNVQPHGGVGFVTSQQIDPFSTSKFTQPQGGDNVSGGLLVSRVSQQQTKASSTPLVMGGSNKSSSLMSTLGGAGVTGSPTPMKPGVPPSQPLIPASSTTLQKVTNQNTQNLDLFSADLFSSTPILKPNSSQNALGGASQSNPSLQNPGQATIEGSLPKPVPRKNTPPVVPNLSDTGPNPKIEPVYAAVIHKNKTKGTPSQAAVENSQRTPSSGTSLLDMFEPSKEALIASEVGNSPPPLPATRPPLEDLEDLLTPTEMREALAEREKSANQEDIFGFGVSPTPQAVNNNQAALIDPVYVQGNFDRGLPHVNQTVAPPMLPAPRKKKMDKQKSNPDLTSSKHPPPLPKSRPVMPEETNAIFMATEGGKKVTSPDATLVIREKKGENESSLGKKIRRKSIKFKQKSLGFFKTKPEGEEKIENKDKINKGETPKNEAQQAIAKPPRPGPPPRPASLPKKSPSQRRSSSNTEPSLLDWDSPTIAQSPVTIAQSPVLIAQSSTTIVQSPALIAQSSATIAQPAPAVQQTSLLDISTTVIAQPSPAVLAELTTAIHEPVAQPQPIIAQLTSTITQSQSTIAQSQSIITQSQSTITQSPFNVAQSQAPVLTPLTTKAPIQPSATIQSPPKPARVRPAKPPPPKIVPSRPPPARPPPRKNLNQNNRVPPQNSVTAPSPKPRSNSNNSTPPKNTGVGPPVRPAPVKPQGNKPARPPPAVPPQKRANKNPPGTKGPGQIKQSPKQTPPQGHANTEPKPLPRHQVESNTVTEIDAGNTTGKMGGNIGDVGNIDGVGVNTPTLSKAMAIFDFNGGADDELSFNAGEEITNISVVDDNWYRGSNGGKSGIFPKGFVTFDATSGNTPSKTPETVDIMSYANWDDHPEVSNDPVLDLNDISTLKSNTDDSNQATPRPDTPSSDKFFDASDDFNNHSKEASPKVDFVGVATEMVANSDAVVTGNDDNKKTSQPTGQTCIAMYAFTGQDGSELTFVEGDVINITSKIDDDWFNGELNGRSGIFPAAYVEEKPQDSVIAPESTDISTNISNPPNNVPSNDSSTTPSGGFVEPMATGVQDYTAPSSDEVSFKVNDVLYLLEEVDSDWLMVQHDQSGAVGKVPKSHIKIVHPLPDGGNSMNWTV